MATAVTTVSRSIIRTGDLDVGGGQLGEFIAIDTNADFSIVPATAPQNFIKYYTHYSVLTEAAIAITLPAANKVVNGWRCKIGMVSNTGAGNITVKNSSNVTVAFIASNSVAGVAYGSVELISLAGIGWSAAYGLPKIAAVGQIFSQGANGFPAYNSSYMGSFFSFCDTALGPVIDANTLTPTALRWANPTGRVLDAEYFNAAASNTRIQPIVSGVFRYTIFIGIDNAGGATQANIQIFPRINGVTFPPSYTIIAGTIQPYIPGVYVMEGCYNFTANDYLEIMVDKSVVSGGTNPVSLTTTSASVRFVA
jgi:hypothetical protein